MFFNGVVCLAALISCGQAHAQLNEQISVDGRYVPEIISVDRIYTSPALPSLSLTPDNLDFEMQGVVTDWRPQTLTMPALTWNASRAVSDKKGYVDMSLGSWLNSNLSAGYRILQSPESLLGLSLQGNSTSLWKPGSVEDKSSGKRFRYDYTLGVYGLKEFSGLGQLRGDFSWRLAWFDYYGVREGRFTRPLHAMPTQTLNDIKANLSWSSDCVKGLPWSAAVAYRGFHYRDVKMPILTVPFHSLWDSKGNRENHFTLKGEINSRSCSENAFFVEAQGDLLIYKGDIDRTDNYYSLWNPRNYGAVFLRPGWRLQKSLFRLRVGLEGALVFNARGVDETKNYGLLHLAPDVRVDFLGQGAAVYIHATGGTRLNTLASLSELDYYQSPVLLTTLPVYSPLDARVGVNLGPWSGFKASLELRYAFENNTPVGGWYMASCNDPMTYLPSYVHPVTRSLHGGAIKLGLGYDYGDMLSARAELNWQPQKGSIGIFNGYDRPKYVASFSLLYRPLSRLALQGDWSLRACRGIYTYTQECEKLPNVSMLSFGANYNVSKNFSLSFRAVNVLNRNEIILPAQISEGVTFCGGFQLEF